MLEGKYLLFNVADTFIILSKVRVPKLLYQNSLFKKIIVRKFHNQPPYDSFFLLKSLTYQTPDEFRQDNEWVRNRLPLANNLLLRITKENKSTVIYLILTIFRYYYLCIKNYECLH